MSCKVTFHVVNQLCRFQCIDLKIIRVQIYSPGLKAKYPANRVSFDLPRSRKDRSDSASRVKAKLSFIFMIIHSLLKQNINHASGEGNENEKKRSIHSLFYLRILFFWSRRGVGRIFPNFPYPPSSLQRPKPVSGVLIINCFWPTRAPCVRIW